jgi:hypothetical protein
MSGLLKLEFAPPGPGSWVLETVHFPRPTTRFDREVSTEPLARGYQVFARRYGLLFGGLAFRFVNGFAYGTIVPLSPSDVSARTRTASATFVRKLWRSDLEFWESEVKPAAIRTHLALQAVDVGQLTAEDLSVHLTRCSENLQRMSFCHHWFNGAALVPVGDFVAHAVRWTGLPQADLLHLLHGATPAGCCGEPAESDAVDVAARTYPDRLAVERVRNGRPDAVFAQQVDRVRDRVPAGERERFDALLREARLTCRLHDERGVLTSVWASGLTRRALLAAGARLAASGQLEQPAHIVDAGSDEMHALLRGARRPRAEEFAERAERRARLRAVEPPAWLGQRPSLPTPLDPLPADAARVIRAVGAAGALFGESDAERQTDHISVSQVASAQILATPSA